MNVLVISCSLHRDSQSARLAEAAGKVLAARGVSLDTVDLRDWPLPICDGLETAEHDSATALGAKIRRARAIVLAVPVYNYYANAAAKNLIELTGRAWRDKTVGFLCAAGGRGSYMSIMSLANSLMLDFRCVIVPRFVYATRSQLGSDPDGLPEEIVGRVAHLCDQLLVLASASVENTKTAIEAKKDSQK